MASKLFHILIFLLFVQYNFAQSDSSLHLQILDQNSSLVPNVSVKLKSNGKIIKETTKEKPQTIVFSKIAPGKYILEIEAIGFNKLIREIEIFPQKNEIPVTLEIAEIIENIDVNQDNREKAIDSVFGSFLTPEQIASLPDDPEQLKKALRQIAGDETAVILVDGFSSDKVPTKSQISSIRIVRSSFDAEYHKIGQTYINITTRAGNQKFSGSLSFNFNDESLNARNTFSPRRFSEQTKTTMLFLSGPLKKNKAAFSFLALDSRNFNGKSINAFLPNGLFQSSTNSRNNGLLIAPKINYDISKTHQFSLSYEFSDSSMKNLGVGDFNLESRGFDIKSRNHQLRFSESGYFGKKFLNEFRFQFTAENSLTIPNSSEVTILVLDSFNSGGAGNKNNFEKTEFGFADNLLFGYKNHALKFGFQFEYEKRNEISELNRNGSFVFSSIADFNLNRPSIFTQRVAESQVSVSQLQFSLFFQDDYRLRKNLNIGFGLRYEIQNNLKDKDNFSPRISFTFSPFKTGKTTIRGGAGFFYDWFGTNYQSQILSNDFSHPSEIIILNPSFPNPFISGTGQLLPNNFWQKDENLKSPAIFHTSFGFDQRLTKTSNFRANYVYEKGTNLFRSRNINAARNGIRPNPLFGNVIKIESTAFFVRNSLILNFNTNLSRHGSLYLNYNLSKIIDDSDGIFSLPSNNYNLRLDRSFSRYDRRHRFSAYYTWQIKKGVRFSGNYSLNSPLPYNITTGFDNNGDTIFNDRPFGVKRNSRRGTWKNQLDLSFSWMFSFIDKKNQDEGKSFAVVTTSGEGSSGFDFTDPKKRFSLKFFVNAENILNRANYNEFAGVETSIFFGKPISAEASRKVNVGIRFNF